MLKFAKVVGFRLLAYGLNHGIVVGFAEPLRALLPQKRCEAFKVTERVRSLKLEHEPDCPTVYTVLGVPLYSRLKPGDRLSVGT